MVGCVAPVAGGSGIVDSLAVGGGAGVALTVAAGVGGVDLVVTGAGAETDGGVGSAVSLAPAGSEDGPVDGGDVGLRGAIGVAEGRGDSPEAVERRLVSAPVVMFPRVLALPTCPSTRASVGR